jgi:ribosomal protein S12 methylthiotransferase accessory factor
MLLGAGAVVAAFMRFAQADGVSARALEPFDEELVQGLLGLAADEELALAAVMLGVATMAGKPRAAPMEAAGGGGAGREGPASLVTLALPVHAITEIPRAGRQSAVPGVPSLLAAEKLLDVTLAVRVPADLAVVPRDLWPAYGRLLHLVRAGLDVEWGQLTFAPDEPRLPAYWVRVEGIRGSAVDVASRPRALQRAVGEAVERFVWRRMPGRHDIRRSKPADLPGAVLDLHTLTGYSDKLRRSDPRLQWGPDTPFHWIRGVSLTAGTPVWVPLQLVSADDRCGDEPELRPRVTTGIAAHPDRDTAVLNGLLEVIERDAFMLTWLARRPTVPLDLERTVNTCLRSFVESLVAARFTPRAVKLATDTGVPVVLGLILDDSGVGPRLSVGAAPHPSAERATLAALGEVLASWKWTQHLARSNRAVPEDAVELDLETRLLWWSQGDRWKDLEWLWTGAEDQVAGDREPALGLHDLTARLRHLGEDVIVVDLTTESLAVRLGYHVVAVVVPGFHPMHLRERRPALFSRRLNTFLCNAGGVAANILPHPFP